jgi:hypothetical protein
MAGRWLPNGASTSAPAAITAPGNVNHVVHLQVQTPAAGQAGPEVRKYHRAGVALPVLVGLLTLYSAGVTGFDGFWGSSRPAAPAGYCVP